MRPYRLRITPSAACTLAWPGALAGLPACGLGLPLRRAAFPNLSASGMRTSPVTVAGAAALGKTPFDRGAFLSHSLFACLTTGTNTSFT